MTYMSIHAAPDSRCRIPVAAVDPHNARVDASPSVVAARLRSLLNERGWSNSHLARLLAERTGKTKKGCLRQVQQWLAGGLPNDRNREDLAAVFNVSPSEFLPALATQAEFDELLGELLSLRRIEAQASAQNAELRTQIERLERLNQRPQEMLKPTAQRKSTGR